MPSRNIKLVPSIATRTTLRVYWRRCENWSEIFWCYIPRYFGRRNIQHKISLFPLDLLLIYSCITDNTCNPYYVNTYYSNINKSLCNDWEMYTCMNMYVYDRDTFPNHCIMIYLCCFNNPYFVPFYPHWLYFSEHFNGWLIKMSHFNPVIVCGSFFLIKP